MPTMVEIAREFFEACETGKGWEGCRAFCKPEASFSAQSEALEGVTTLQAYTDWMAGLFAALPDGSYEVRSFATDEATSTVCAYAVFTATHTGAAGPQPPTGKTTHADYVYVMQFEGAVIGHMTKIWNSGWTLRELGWA
jgi:predicted ester cyclase